jgi:hypothetical protein
VCTERSHIVKKEGRGMKRWLAAIAALSTVGAFSGSAVRAPATGAGRSAATTKAFGKVPLAFEPNAGQMGSDIKFLAHSGGDTVLLGPNEAVLSVSEPGMFQRPNAAPAIGSKLTPSDRVVMTFIGANPGVALVPEDRLPGVSNYFIGNDPRAWRTNIPQYGRVTYQDLYPGIDLTFYGNQADRLEYDFALQPGADPSLIRLAFQGAAGLDIDSSGGLSIGLAHTHLLQPKPLIYQVVDGTRTPISGGYVLDGDQVRFAAGAFDRTRPLVIDPEVEYSTYLGGSADELPEDIATDGSGHAYVCGVTDSTDFPVTLGVVQPSLAGAFDGFITEMTADGSGLVYSTYLGGNDFDDPVACAVDASGNLYMIGTTNSTDFPTTEGAYQRTNKGGSDGFIAKLSPDGLRLLYSTYLGGSGDEFTSTDGLAVDPAGDVVVTGDSNSTDFPTTPGAYQTANAGCQGQFCRDAPTDIVVAKLNAAGSGLVYSTYLGGPGNDLFPDLSMDAAGDVYLKWTAEGDRRFPTTPGAFQPHDGGGSDDALTAKLDPAGSSLIYATYLGGGGADIPISIAIDAAGHAYVGGLTSSRNFPVTPGAFQPKYAGGTDGFVTEVNTQGTGLVSSTYLGGSSFDLVDTVTGVDSSGHVVIDGITDSTDFPVTHDAFQSTNHGGGDGFIAQLTADGSELLFSTYWGGSGLDTISIGGGALDSSDNLYVTGCTSSTDLSVTPGAFQTTFQGGVDNIFCGDFPTDAYVTKVAFGG